MFVKTGEADFFTKKLKLHFGTRYLPPPSKSPVFYLCLPGVFWNQELSKALPRGRAKGRPAGNNFIQAYGGRIRQCAHADERRDQDDSRICGPSLGRIAAA